MASRIRIRNAGLLFHGSGRNVYGSTTLVRMKRKPICEYHNLRAALLKPDEAEHYATLAWSR